MMAFSWSWPLFFWPQFKNVLISIFLALIAGLLYSLVSTYVDDRQGDEHLAADHIT
jgi:hypothetical protein